MQTGVIENEQSLIALPPAIHVSFFFPVSSSSSSSSSAGRGLTVGVAGNGAPEWARCHTHAMLLLAERPMIFQHLG